MSYIEQNLLPEEKIIYKGEVHWIIYATSVKQQLTELAITSNRIIAKFGLISRITIELNTSKIESLSVHQGIIERFVDAGSIIIHGTGGASTPIQHISKQLEFRNKAMELFNK